MRDTKQTTNKNITYIVIFTIMIIVVALLIIFIPKLKNKDTSSSNSSPDSVSVMSTEGSQDETISKSIKNLTDVKFGSKRKSISSYEKKQKGTQDGSYAASSDGKVAYLTYKFSEKNPPEYFGAQVLPTDSNALLQYVLNEKGKLYEVRLQYGKLSKDSYDAIVSNISGTYGNYTFARTYSNGSTEHWWKTKSITLIAYYQSTSVSVYLRKN